MNREAEDLIIMQDSNTIRNLTTIFDQDEDVYFGFKASTYSITQIVIFGTISIILSVITVIGNIMVMISFKIDKQLQTISNYFLFSLAVADFAIGLISMPLFTVYTLMGYWPLTPFICDTWLALDYLVSNASVLNLLIISFDRYYSVTRPLTYRVKRTTSKAAFMITAAWGISLLLWPPWIYSWPYIEGKRTVPKNECYIQFIETNHYITFGTAIAAFYIPVSVMIFLYWRIWRETEKRQKDLPNLQAFQNRLGRKSISSDKIIDTNSPDESLAQRQKSEHSINLSARIEIDSIDFNTRKKPKWQRKCLKKIRNCCSSFLPKHKSNINIEVDSGIQSDQIISCGYLTPTSDETVIAMTESRINSLNIIKDLNQQNNGSGQNRYLTPPCSSKTSAVKLSSSSDSLYTILIHLPSEKCTGTSTTQTDQPVIKMISEKTKFDKSNTKYNNNNNDDDDNDNNNNNKQQRNQIETSCYQLPLNLKTFTAVKKEKDRDRDKKKKGPEKKADRKAAKTLSAILLTFIITWTPYNILVLLKPFTAIKVPTHLWDFFYYLCYINSTINPVCYALCNAAFRKTYIRILTCKWKNRIRVAINRGIFNH